MLNCSHICCQIYPSREIVGSFAEEANPYMSSQEVVQCL